ncbi:MAG TPA: imidazoleglycerol-phosphate dehydratase HisB [Armatimonadota bacterium]|jgi:imidazoleglycerol-phosphate dehydratase|nr:imidazoleglycerol-phosphate dehydratase HisB [Armatimonadota bacterium]
MRTANMERNTAETRIALSINLDGTGNADIATSVGFLDHMLTLFAKHSGCDLSVQASGDIQVDAHHLTEDIGIVLGMAIKQALGDKRGIRRYGDILLPMDEVLMMVAVDCSGRPFFVWDVTMPQPKVGEWDSELAEDFFRALAFNGGLTLHMRMLSGKNTHHIAEAAFKGCARALREAFSADPRETGVPSTKGTLAG